jgi:hypothetical protein
MGILYNGNAFDAQVVASGSSTAVNGLNIGASGVAFVMPASFSSSTKQVQFAATDGTVTVSGIGATINGSAAPLTVTALTGKTLYAVSGNTWYSF